MFADQKISIRFFQKSFDFVAAPSTEQKQWTFGQIHLQLVLNDRNRNNIRKRGCCKIIDSFHILFTFRDLARFFTKPYYSIIETADNNTVGYASFFVRQTALPAGSNSSSERWILRFMVVLLVDAYVVNCYYLPLWRKMLPNHRCQIFKRLLWKRDKWDWKEWLYMFKYPLAVTIDTNIFDAAKFDLCDTSPLKTLENYVKNGKIGSWRNGLAEMFSAMGTYLTGMK